MGFIRAALSAGLNSFNDSKFKEAIVLPDNVSGDALAIKGQLLTKDPDGRSRHSNQNTGLLSDGSVVIVPQGYTAVLVNNGTFLGEVLEAGSHEWQAGDNAWLLEKGGLKGTWENFKNRFSFGGQVITKVSFPSGFSMNSLMRTFSIQTFSKTLVVLARIWSSSWVLC